MACHRHFFDRAHVGEGLWRDGHQSTKQNLRNTGIQFLIHDLPLKKDNIADYRRVLLKKKALFFLQLRAMRKGFVRFPASSQHFDGCNTQQQTFDLTVAEINGNDRISAFVLCFDDRAHAEMVMRDPVSDMHVRDAQAAPIVGLACL